MQTICICFSELHIGNFLSTGKLRTRLFQAEKRGELREMDRRKVKLLMIFGFHSLVSVLS